MNLFLLSLGLLVVIGGILLIVFESAYRGALQKKEWTIALLREQIRMTKEHDEAREVAARIGNDPADLELNALALLAGPPGLFETFLHLTDHVSIGFQWDPLKEPIHWEGSGRPTHEEIKRNAALLVLRDGDYTGDVLPAGFGGYAVVASNKAMAVRAVCNRIPETLKAKVREEQPRSQMLTLPFPDPPAGPPATHDTI